MICDMIHNMIQFNPVNDLQYGFNFQKMLGRHIFPWLTNVEPYH